MLSGITGLLSMPFGKPSDYHDINNPQFSSQQAMPYGIDEENYPVASQQAKEHEGISIDAPQSSSERQLIESKTSDITAFNLAKGAYESDAEPQRVNIETTESV